MAHEDRPHDYWVSLAGIGFESDLARLMEVSGLSQVKLAERIGKSPAYVSRVLNGAYGNYTLGTMVNFARAMGARVEVRLTLEGQETTRVMDLETAARLDDGQLYEGAEPASEERDESPRRLKIA